MTTPAKPSLEDFITYCETWQIRRTEEAAEFRLRGFRAFVELMNYETRRLIGLTHKEDPEFWSAVAELATNAQTLLTKGAKLRADHQDVTNL